MLWFKSKKEDQIKDYDKIVFDLSKIFDQYLLKIVFGACTLMLTFIALVYTQKLNINIQYFLWAWTGLFIALMSNLSAIFLAHWMETKRRDNIILEKPPFKYNKFIRIIIKFSNLLCFVTCITSMILLILMLHLGDYTNG